MDISRNKGIYKLLQWKQWETFLGSKSLQMVTAVMKLQDACSWEEKLWPIYTTY